MKARGFTLIEVTVALAIVAVSLAAGVRAASVMADNADRLAQVSAAEWCADNQLTLLRLTHQFPGVGDSEFTCQQLGRTYKGTMQTRPTPNPIFRRIDTTVSSEGGLPLFTLSTVLGRN